jgi:predicted peptidase
MTWNMIVSFPEYFAGAFPIAATGTVTAADVKTCKNVAIWMLASIKDPVISYVATTTPLWNNVCQYNTRPELCRLSSFSNVVEPAGSSASDNHHMAKVVTYDLHMLDGSAYKNVTTKDGNGNTVTLNSPNGMIYWMNTVSSDYAGSEGSGSGNTSVNGITRALSLIRNFFLKIVNIFQRLFGL